MRYHFLLRITGIMLAAKAARARAENDPRCRDVTFRVEASVDNLVFNNPPDMTNETSIRSFVAKVLEITNNGTITTTGEFDIQGLYCQPTTKQTHDTLQVLVHGATYNKAIWSGFDYSTEYDWHLFANSRGYHTLAIDRVSHGANLQHPDPLEVVQGYLSAETTHQVIQTIRTGGQGTNPLPRTFDRIAYVGHSYGSETGAAIAGKYPEDIDALVATGYSSSMNLAFAALELISASTRPGEERLSQLPLGYLVAANVTERSEFFFAGSYDPRLLAIDSANDDTITVGEFGTVAFGLAPAVGFKKPVLIATADRDAIFCAVQEGQDGSSCGEILESTSALFPDASTFETYVAEDAGHCLTLHHSAPQTLEAVHAFLDQFF